MAAASVTAAQHGARASDFKRRGVPADATGTRGGVTPLVFPDQWRQLAA
jgi:hypothetical protein